MHLPDFHMPKPKHTISWQLTSKLAGLVLVAVVAAGIQLAPALCARCLTEGSQAMHHASRFVADSLHMSPAVFGLPEITDPPALTTSPTASAATPAPVVLADVPEEPKPEAIPEALPKMEFFTLPVLATEPTPSAPTLMHKTIQLFIQGSQVRTILLCPVDRSCVEPAGDLIGAGGPRSRATALKVQTRLIEG